MRNDKHIAFKLRKEGKSYNKIGKKLGIAKSTLSGWFEGLDWSEKIRNELTQKALYIARKRLRLVNKKRKIMWEAWRERAREEARQQFTTLYCFPLFVAGIMLYWGEGDSKLENSIVRLSNTSPDMIRVFSLFLRDICNVPNERLCGSLVLYNDLDQKKCRLFWSQVSGIPEAKFHKTQFIQGRHPTKRLTYGICTIIVNSRELKEKVFVWINLFQKNHPVRV